MAKTTKYLSRTNWGFFSIRFREY